MKGLKCPDVDVNQLVNMLRHSSLAILYSPVLPGVPGPSPSVLKTVQNQKGKSLPQPSKSL